MPTPAEIYEALEARRAELGLSQADIGARAFGRADNAAFQALRRGSSPSADKLAALCGAVGWEFYFGPPRESGAVEKLIIDSDEYAHVPLHDALVAAGNGSSNGSEAIVDSLAFRKDWLKRIGVTSSAARLARVHGESMQPTLWNGDVVLIDTRATAPIMRAKDTRDQRRSPVYAIIDAGEARVKRVQRLSETSILLLSDNPDYAPELRQDADLAEVKIIGRVAWCGHTLRE